MDVQQFRNLASKSGELYFVLRKHKKGKLEMKKLAIANIQKPNRQLPYCVILRI